MTMQNKTVGPPPGMEKTAISTKMIQKLQGAGAIPSDVTADTLMNAMRTNDWTGVPSNTAAALVDYAEKLSPEYFPAARMREEALKRGVVPRREVRVVSREDLDRFNTEIRNQYNRIFFDALAAQEANIPHTASPPTLLSSALGAAGKLKRTLQTHLGIPQTEAPLVDHMTPRIKSKYFDDPVNKAKIEEFNALREQSAWSMNDAVTLKRRMDETPSARAKTLAGHPNKKVMSPNTVTRDGQPIMGEGYAPSSAAYHGTTHNPRSRFSAPDDLRWTTAHPEVAMEYAAASHIPGTAWERHRDGTSRVFEYDTRKIPKKDQSAWQRHYEEGDIVPEGIDHIRHQNSGYSPARRVNNSPTYEKIVTDHALRPALSRRWKPLPGGDMLELENLVTTGMHKRSSVKTRDIELWEAYKANPGPHTLQPLMQQLDPVIQSEVNRWAGAISRPVLETKAKGLALEAIKSYNPNAGAALATHVTNRLKKISREVYTHQDAVRVPEYKKLKFNAYHRSTEELMSLNGREPTDVELADHLGWSRKMVADVQRSMRPELIESLDTGAGLFERKSVWGSDSDDGLVDMLYFDMDPIDKLIFEHSTGYSGKPILSNPQLAAKTGLTQGQLSYRKRRIIDKVSEIMD
jgi:hypothetical protein